MDRGCSGSLAVELVEKRLGYESRKQYENDGRQGYSDYAQ